MGTGWAGHATEGLPERPATGTWGQPWTENSENPSLPGAMGWAELGWAGPGRAVETLSVLLLQETKLNQRLRRLEHGGSLSGVQELVRSCFSSYLRPPRERADRISLFLQ